MGDRVEENKVQGLGDDPFLSEFKIPDADVGMDLDLSTIIWEACLELSQCESLDLQGLIALGDHASSKRPEARFVDLGLYDLEVGEFVHPQALDQLSLKAIMEAKETFRKRLVRCELVLEDVKMQIWDIIARAVARIVDLYDRNGEFSGPCLDVVSPEAANLRKMSRKARVDFFAEQGCARPGKRVELGEKIGGKLYIYISDDGQPYAGFKPMSSNDVTSPYVRKKGCFAIRGGRIKGVRISPDILTKFSELAPGELISVFCEGELSQVSLDRRDSDVLFTHQVMFDVVDVFDGTAKKQVPNASQLNGVTKLPITGESIIGDVSDRKIDTEIGNAVVLEEGSEFKVTLRVSDVGYPSLYQEGALPVRFYRLGDGDMKTIHSKMPLNKKKFPELAELAGGSENDSVVGSYKIVVKSIKGESGVFVNDVDYDLVAV